jgi:hypothetical protein
MLCKDMVSPTTSACQLKSRLLLTKVVIYNEQEKQPIYPLNAYFFAFPKWSWEHPLVNK